MELLNKRYWVFAWADYEANGGLNDVRFASNNRERALMYAQGPLARCDNVDVVDMQTGAHEYVRGDRVDTDPVLVELDHSD